VRGKIQNFTTKFTTATTTCEAMHSKITRYMFQVPKFLFF